MRPHQPLPETIIIWYRVISSSCPFKFFQKLALWRELFLLGENIGILFFVAIFRCEMSKTPLGHLPVRLNYKGIICLRSKFEQEKRDDDLGKTRE